MSRLSGTKAEHQYDTDEAEEKICEHGEHDYDKIIKDSDATNMIDRFWCTRCKHWIEELTQTAGVVVYNEKKEQVYENIW